MELGKVSPSADSPISYALNAASGLPAYLQIVQQTEDALTVGYLTVGDRLPRVKDVAEHLAINPNTVLKAYAELESRGLARGKQGVGTFVTAAPHAVDVTAYLQLRRSLAAGWLRDAKAAGLNEDAIIAIVRSALADGGSDVGNQQPGEVTA